MAPPNGTPRNMSSRLMNMKFMQRAAASETSSPSTPAEPAAKKQRLANGTPNSAPASTPASTPRSGSQAAAETPASGDRDREDPFAREAAARGDSKWYLSFKEPQPRASPSSLRIVSAGYGALDTSQPPGDQFSEDEEEDEARTRSQIAGRRSFGKFNKTVEKHQRDGNESDSDSSEGSASDDEEDDDSDDPTGVNALIAAERKEAGDKARAERKAQKAAGRADAARMADERRKKDVNLNNITSISGFGGGGTRKPPGLETRECHQCGGKGHLKHQCPQTHESQRKRKLA